MLTEARRCSWQRNAFARWSALWPLAVFNPRCAHLVAAGQVPTSVVVLPRRVEGRLRAVVEDLPVAVPHVNVAVFFGYTDARVGCSADVANMVSTATYNYFIIKPTAVGPARLTVIKWVSRDGWRRRTRRGGLGRDSGENQHTGRCCHAYRQSPQKSMPSNSVEHARSIPFFPFMPDCHQGLDQTVDDQGSIA